MSKNQTMRIPKIRQLKSGSFHTRIRIDGIDIPITRPTEKEVEDEYIALKRGIKDVKQEAAKREKSITLSDAIGQYIQSKSNVLSPGTIRGYTIFWKYRFQPAMNLNIYEVSQEKWQMICNDEALLCCAKTLKNAWGFVSTVICSATGMRIRVTLPQVVKNEHEFLDDEQIKTFIPAVKDKTCAIPAMLALCSLRISEIMALGWDDIDFNKKTISVSGSVVFNKENKLVLKETNKNTTSNRIVPILIPELEDLLKSAKDGGRPIISRSSNSTRYEINRICKANGLPEVGLHGLRHSFASLSYYLGLNEKVCQSIGGWSDDKTMREIYTHIASKEISKAASKIRLFYESGKENETNKDSEISALKKELAELRVKYSAISDILTNAISEKR